MTFEWKDDLHVDTTFVMDGYVDGATERYTVKKSDDGRWQIVENRFWPRVLKSDGKKTIFDAKEWSKRDAAIARAPNDRERRAALLDARHHAEAYELAKTLCESEDATQEDWVARANIALLVGDAEDAVASARKAEGATLPSWASAALAAE